jgi:hypothetical protein
MPHLHGRRRAPQHVAGIRKHVHIIAAFKFAFYFNLHSPNIGLSYS